MAGFLVQSSVPTTNSKAAPSNTTTHWQMGLPSQAPLPLTALPLSNSPHQEHPPAPAWGCSGHLLPHRAPPTLTLEFYPVFFFFFNITIVFKTPPPNIFCPLSNVIPQRHCSSADWLSCAQCQVLQSYMEHARTCPSWQGPASTSPHSTFLQHSEAWLCSVAGNALLVTVTILQDSQNRPQSHCFFSKHNQEKK